MPNYTQNPARQEAQGVMTHLLDRERIRGATRMIPEGTPEDRVSDDQISAVREQVNKYARAVQMSRDTVGKAIGMSGPTISEFLGGKYRGNNAKLAIELDSWLEAEYKRQDAPSTVRFVWTGVARQIQAVANICRQTRTIGMVYGPETSGIGKTWSLKALNAELPGSILVSIEKVHANPTGLLRAIARAMHLNDGKSNRALYDRIRGTLAGTPRLLMVDQIHNLRGSKGDRPLFMLADLYDATGAPQLWSGTSDMVEYLNRGQAKGEETLAQIRSRIFYQQDLMERTRPESDGGRGEPLVSIDDIRQAYGNNKLKLTSDGARFLCEVANLPDGGALRTVTNIVTIATMVAEQMGAKSLNAELLRKAFRGSTTAQKFQLLNERLDEARPMTMRLAAG